MIISLITPSLSHSLLNKTSSLLNLSTHFRRSRSTSSFHSSTTSSLSSPTTSAYLGIGSNISPRFPFMLEALTQISLMPSTKLTRTSFLYETKPMYVTDQSSFLNACLKIETSLPPMELLDELKKIEDAMGRVETIRNGPRNIDLDILIYGEGESEVNIDAPEDGKNRALTVPHPRISEREFVLRPLTDIYPSYACSLLSSLLSSLSSGEVVQVVQVLPLPRNRTLHLSPYKTLIMGILNVTPDSFSDGGKHNSVSSALEQAEKMIKDGCDIIDIGGESTRPDADLISIDEELKRTVDVVKALRNQHEDIPISIDTRSSVVARAAIEAGADIVNDVSGGAHDPNMLSTIKSLSVPCVLMHTRGTPQTMKTLANYNDIIKEVSEELMTRVNAAENAGLQRWLQVLDVGIGFAKNQEHNLELLANCNMVAKGVDHIPMLVGASRKGFIGALTSVEKTEERDFGSIAATLAGMGEGGARIVRVHNVKGMKNAAIIYDAIYAKKRERAAAGGRGAEEKEIGNNNTSMAGKVRRTAKEVDISAKRPTVVCDPYEQGGKPLLPRQANDLLGTLEDGWKLSEDNLILYKEFEHKTYSDGNKFLTQVGFVGFNNNHYPKITLERRLGRKEWKFVSRVECATAVLKGLSFNDFQVAMLIDLECTNNKAIKTLLML